MLTCNISSLWLARIVIVQQDWFGWILNVQEKRSNEDLNLEAITNCNALQVVVASGTVRSEHISEILKVDNSSWMEMGVDPSYTDSYYLYHLWRSQLVTFCSCYHAFASVCNSWMFQFALNCVKGLCLIKSRYLLAVRDSTLNTVCRTFSVGCRCGALRVRVLQIISIL